MQKFSGLALFEHLDTLYDMSIRKTQRDLMNSTRRGAQADKRVADIRDISRWELATGDALIAPLLNQIEKIKKALPAPDDGEISTAILDAIEDYYPDRDVSRRAFDQVSDTAHKIVLAEWISAAEQLEDAAEKLKKALVLLALFRYIPQNELAEALDKPAPTLAKWAKQADEDFTTPPPAPIFD